LKNYCSLNSNLEIEMGFTFKTEHWAESWLRGRWKMGRAACGHAGLSVRRQDFIF
jgi:hypothetical protein